ncbi:hypothetical protein BDR26DRAFT_936733 [Obelidium mucronatum]|nr:hypothetical protein BDR26DRAFT_936733 [Obelidium mucronatum]
MAKTPQRRVYKKTPIHERIASAPYDFLLFLNEWLQLCEWDEWLDKASNSIGIAFNVIYLLVKTYDGDVFTDDEFIEYSALKSTTATTVSSTSNSSWLHSLSRFIEALVILVSLANTAFLIKRSQSFTLFHHPTEPDENRPFDDSWNLKAKTKNANLVSLDVAPTDATLIESDSEDEDDNLAFKHTPTPLKRRGVTTAAGSLAEHTFEEFEGCNDKLDTLEYRQKGWTETAAKFWAQGTQD